jgi:hypothetical protein
VNTDAANEAVGQNGDSKKEKENELISGEQNENIS